MFEDELHEMTLLRRHDDGSEEWLCEECGRHMVLKCGEQVELTSTIAGVQRMAGGDPYEVVQPHRHAAVLGTSANATNADVSDAVDAALAAARLRLRPILMTAFAFILGVVPLAIASGAGAEGRRILGTGVIGGMLAATLIAIFLIPVTFYVVQRLSSRGEGPEAPAHPAPEPGSAT